MGKWDKNTDKDGLDKNPINPTKNTIKILTIWKPNSNKPKMLTKKF